MSLPESSPPRRRIERLSDELVNKIAAGEVVERPASVVKELMENALDAGARNVEVRIQAGGKSLIRVKDDGHGMRPEDARRAVERHATSKLRTLDDLASLTTSGFRGEALPSIAAVSHLVLRTRDASGPAGTEVEVRHGRPPRVGEVGHPVGTTVEVKDLFGEVPARRKFLRGDATEAGHVAEVATQLALARPSTGFTVLSGERSVLLAPPVGDLRARVYQLFGGDFLENLVPVDGGEGWVRVSGLISRPGAASAHRGVSRLFVNGRPIRDRALYKAIAEGFRAAGGGERPEAIVFLEVPPHLVDVNVHPAKTEVRFAETRTVWAAVEGAVRASLSSGGRGWPPRADTSRIEESVGRYLVGSSARPESASPRLFGPAALVDAEPGDRSRLDEARARDALGEAPLSVIGQHRNTYIVATDGEDLLLVDQHTAHERVRFEWLIDRLQKRAVESQGLLQPLVVALPPELLSVVEAHAATLGEVGFDVEGFGGGAVRLGAVPALLSGRDAAGVLTSLLRDFLERESGQWTVSGARDRLAATLACHSAARAGEALARENMAAILHDLARTAHPMLCPHGRPTVVRIPREDLSRWFGRSGWRRQ